MADADSDGLHIATLLCALFVRHFKPLVEAGHVYVAMPPLYRIDIGKEVFYALDEGERDGILDRSIEQSKSRRNIQSYANETIHGIILPRMRYIRKAFYET